MNSNNDVCSQQPYFLEKRWLKHHGRLQKQVSESASPFLTTHSPCPHGLLILANKSCFGIQETQLLSHHTVEDFFLVVRALCWQGSHQLGRSCDDWVLELSIKVYNTNYLLPIYIPGKLRKRGEKMLRRMGLREIWNISPRKTSICLRVYESIFSSRKLRTVIM